MPEIKVIMVDKDLTNINVLKEFFPNAKILYCLFHVIKWLKGVISKLHFQEVDMKNKVMVEIKAMVWAASEEIYSEHYGNFQNLCEESNLMLDTEKPLFDYFIDNWHNCKEDWVIFYRRFIPTFGTNTNNHLESFNRNLKISVNHHLHLTASIKEIIKVFNVYFNDFAKQEHLQEHSKIYLYIMRLPKNISNDNHLKITVTIKQEPLI